MAIILKTKIDEYLHEWTGGPKLINGVNLVDLATQLFSVQDNIAAHPGGGQAGATQLTAAYCDVSIVTTNNDSVMLPYAIPGSSLNLSNSSNFGMFVWAQPSNPYNGGLPDVYMSQNSNTPVTNAGFGAGYVANFYCTKPGIWRRNI